MAAVRPNTVKTIALLVPLFAMLTICFLSLLRNKPGRYHDKAVELWQSQKWSEIQALADNLHQTGRSDTETLYFAMLASSEAQNPNGVRLFAERLAQRKMLNLKIERALGTLYHPEQPVQRIAIAYRTRAFLIIALIISLLLTLAIRQPEKYVPWTAVFSLVGTAVLLI